MNELYRTPVTHRGEALEKFSMNRIEVDGIESSIFSETISQYRVTPNWMFTLKDEDIEEEADEEDSEGFLDDTEYNVDWGGEGIEVSLSPGGKLNEELWLREGLIQFS